MLVGSLHSPSRPLPRRVSIIRPRLIRHRSPGSYYSPHILITGVIFPNAPFSVAHSTPIPSSPRPAGRPAKRHPPPLIMAIIQRPAHSTSKDEAKDGTRGWRAVFRSSHRLVVPRIRRRPVAYCPQGLSIPGRRQFPWHISRTVFLSSSHPPRLIASSIQRLAIPFGQAGKQARQDGGRSSAVLGPVIVSPPRLVIAPSRPSCRMGRAKGVSFLSTPSHPSHNGASFLFR